jgi:hypothetical protein
LDERGVVVVNGKASGNVFYADIDRIGYCLATAKKPSKAKESTFQEIYAHILEVRYGDLAIDPRTPLLSVYTTRARRKHDYVSISAFLFA